MHARDAEIDKYLYQSHNFYEKPKQKDDYCVKDLQGKCVTRKHIGNDQIIKEGEKLKEKRLYNEELQRKNRK